MFRQPYEVEDREIEDIGLRHYVELRIPIGSNDRKKVEEIPRKDPSSIDLYLGLSPRVGCYRLFDRMEATVRGETRIDRPDDRKGDKRVGKPINISGIYYIDGEVYNSETIEEAYNKYAHPESEREDLEEMLESSSSGALVRTRKGFWREFEEDDEIIKADQLE